VTRVVACSLLTLRVEVLLLPAATSPHSEPFLLVRPSLARDVTDVTDDEAEEPAAKSVPPRTPLPAATTRENDLPSVIVDTRELEDELAELESAVQEQCAQLEARRKSDVDGLLEAVDLCVVAPEDVRRQPTLPSIEREPTRGFARSFALGLLAALVIGGGAFEAVLHLTHH
jgi:hypothetical protein